MADYQEYRRRILHRRWRRVFIIVALLALVALLSAIGILWKVLHRERVDTALSQNTILRQVTTDNTWNTVNYPLARQLRVQTLEGSTETALDFRMAALPASAPVEKSWFAQVSFVGDSLTQGLQIYDTGLPGAQFCAYKGVDLFEEILMGHSPGHFSPRRSDTPRRHPERSCRGSSSPPGRTGPAVLSAAPPGSP